MMDTPRLSRRPFLFALLALLVNGAAAASQMNRMPDTTIHPLEVPAQGKLFMCHEDTALPATVKAQHVRAWEFGLGGSAEIPPYLQPRQITAQFDSSGTPQGLTDMVSLVPVRNELVAMFFDGNAAWGRAYETRFDSTSLARMESLAAAGRFREFGKVMPPTNARDITAEEAKRALTLMHWLWDHRCDLHSADGHQP